MFKPYPDTILKGAEVPVREGVAVHPLLSGNIPNILIPRFIFIVSYHALTDGVSGVEMRKIMDKVSYE